MICDPCKVRSHNNCRGGTWCDCQHKVKKEAPPNPVVDSVEPKEEVITPPVPSPLLLNHRIKTKADE